MRIKEAFEKRKTNGQKALITYIVSGDFGYETTKKNIMSMVNAGADIIEIGIPFSDPIAEGIVIQEASQHSLEGGTTPVSYTHLDVYKRQVQRHYYKHLKGEETSTNSVATIFAWTGALRKRGELDSNEELVKFADRLEKATICLLYTSQIIAS